MNISKKFLILFLILVFLAISFAGEKQLIRSEIVEVPGNLIVNYDNWQIEMKTILSINVNKSQDILDRNIFDELYISVSISDTMDTITRSNCDWIIPGDTLEINYTWGDMTFMIVNNGKGIYSIIWGVIGFNMSTGGVRDTYGGICIWNTNNNKIFKLIELYPFSYFLHSGICFAYAGEYVIFMKDLDLDGVDEIIIEYESAGVSAGPEDSRSEWADHYRQFKAVVYYLEIDSCRITKVSRDGEDINLIGSEIGSSLPCLFEPSTIQILKRWVPVIQGADTLELKELIFYPGSHNNKLK